MLPSDAFYLAAALDPGHKLAKPVLGNFTSGDLDVETVARFALRALIVFGDTKPS